MVPMFEYRNTLCIIMGGGMGKRMFPLTSYRSKPAVPLGGRYRLIDVPISNCLNSGFNKILVLTQYNSESLNKHIFRTYKLDAFFKGFVEILAAEQSYERTEWFQGTADSVRRSLPHIHDPNINEVIVLSGDQLYTMDLSLLQAEHHRSGADITIACHPEPPEQVRHFGIMGVDAEGKITSFVEKPKDISAIPSKPIAVNGKPHYLASMGIYIFKKEVLRELLTRSDKDDFGKEIIPDAIGKKRMQAYIYNGYWSDIGTIASFYQASLMMTERKPAFDLYNEAWQIYTRPRNLPPAKIFRCRVEDSIMAEGCIVDEAEVIRSVVGIRSRIGKRTRIEGAIINGNDFYESEDALAVKEAGNEPSFGIGSDCLIRNAIIDKNVSIGDGTQITNTQNLDNFDGPNYSIRDGIVVVHKGAVISNGSVI